MSDKNYVTVKTKLGGFTTLLAIAFIVLKLCNVITWSWLWVLAPLWIPVVIAVFAIAVLFLCFLIFD